MKFTNKNIILDNDKILREKSVDVTFPLSDEDRETIDGLREYVKNSIHEDLCEEYDLQPAVGMAAVQVGILKKMCAIYIEDFDGNVECDLKLINPRIISHSVVKSFLEGGEGCLSVQDPHEGYVHRYKNIKVRYYDEDGNKQVVELTGFPAIAVQHEIDHLSGKMFYDYIDQTNPYRIVENSKPLVDAEE